MSNKRTQRTVRKARRGSVIALSVSLPFVGLLGCAAPLEGTIAQWAGSDQATSRSYVRKQDGPFSLLHVLDDGRQMFLEFEFYVPPVARFFNQEGHEISASRSGCVVALDGLHDSVLITIGSRRYLVEAIQNEADESAKTLVETPDVRRLRQTLVSEPPLQRAFQKIQSRTFPGELIPTPTTPANPQIANLLSNQDSRIKWLAPRAPQTQASPRPMQSSQSTPGESLVRFRPGELQPQGPGEPIEQLLEAARRQLGLIVLRPILTKRADASSVKLADKRVQYLASVIQAKGIANQQVIIGRPRTIESFKPDDNLDSNAVEISFLTR